MLPRGIVFSLVFLASLRDRYANGLNYLPVHVSVGGVDASAVSVESVSQWGSCGLLAVDPRRPGAWVQSPEIPGVTKICVIVRGEFTEDDLAIEVRCGESWQLAGQQMCSRYVQENQEWGEKCKRFTIIFESPPDSIFSSAKGCINWQGDLFLITPPLAQALLACALLQICKRSVG